MINKEKEFFEKETNNFINIGIKIYTECSETEKRVYGVDKKLSNDSGSLIFIEIFKFEDSSKVYIINQLGIKEAFLDPEKAKNRAKEILISLH